MQPLSTTPRQINHLMASRGVMDRPKCSGCLTPMYGPKTKAQPDNNQLWVSALASVWVPAEASAVVIGLVLSLTVNPCWSKDLPDP